LFISSIRKTIRAGNKKFNHTAFVELFMAHLLVKNSRFYHLLKPGYMQNKKYYNLWASGIVVEKTSLVFSNTLFTRKTALDV